MRGDVFGNDVYDGVAGLIDNDLVPMIRGLQCGTLSTRSGKRALPISSRDLSDKEMDAPIPILHHIPCGFPYIAGTWLYSTVRWAKPSIA
jgi:hypothetical protein